MKFGLADRLGGVVFDVQKYRQDATIIDQLPTTTRERLIATISELCLTVEKIDEELRRGDCPYGHTNGLWGSGINAGKCIECFTWDGLPNAAVDIRPRVAGDLLPTPHRCRWADCTFIVIDVNDYCTAHRSQRTVAATGIHLSGWHCPSPDCGVFNGEEKEHRDECKSCGLNVKVARR